MGTQTPRYLVLGGSAGIGLAFAMLRARQRADLVIIARHSRKLKKACELLRREGAKHVRPVQLDLSNTAARRAFLHSVTQRSSFDGIFVGGPSPPPGQRKKVTAKMAAVGYKVALEYPLDAIDFARVALRPRGTLIILSSSASREPLHDHEFFLSAAFRRLLNLAVKEFEPVLSATGRRLIMWRPKVVLTQLSESYARAQAHVTTKEAILAWLKSRHGVSKIPTAIQFAEKMERVHRVRRQVSGRALT